MKKLISVLFIIAFAVCVCGCSKNDNYGIYIGKNQIKTLDILIYSGEGGVVSDGEGIYATITELIEKHRDEIPVEQIGGTYEITLVQGGKTEVKLVGIYDENGTKTGYGLDDSVPLGEYYMCVKRTYSGGSDYLSEYLMLKILIK